MEFCGGTHLTTASDARQFALVAEESVSKGIRRIVAWTGENARRAHEADRDVDRWLSEAVGQDAASLHATLQGINQKIASGQLSLRSKRRAHVAVADLQARARAADKAGKATGGAGDVSIISSAILEQSTLLGPGKLLVAHASEATADELLATVDSLKKKAVSHAIMLASAGNGKVNFVSAVSDDFIKLGLKAGDWIRETAKVAGGGGGGRPQLAQAGGKDPAKIDEALKKARDYATSAIS